MNKKIIIIFLSLFSLFGIVLVVLILSHNPEPQNPQTVNKDNSYTISITDLNKTLNATMTANGKTVALTEITLPQYATVAFNNPHDIMWVTCAKNYSVSNATSSTGNSVSVDQITGIGMNIISGQSNALTFQCSK